MQNFKNFFTTKPSLDQARDTGMAMVFICLIATLATGGRLWLILATGALLLNMIRPAAYGPVARVWFGLAHLLGSVMSRIILSLLFFLLVTPVGLLRRLSGKDTLQLKRWKKDTGSVFHIRDTTFAPGDLEQPY